MIVRCIDDRDAKKVLEVGLDYEAVISGNKYKLILSKEYKAKKNLSFRYHNSVFSKDRFVVIKE